MRRSQVKLKERDSGANKEELRREKEGRRGREGLAHRDENVVLSMGVEIRDEVRQFCKGGGVVGEVQVLAHVVYVIPLGVLSPTTDGGEEEGGWEKNRRQGEMAQPHSTTYKFSTYLWRVICQYIYFSLACTVTKR